MNLVSPVNTNFINTDTSTNRFFIVFVTGSDSITSGGFDWFYRESDALANFDALKKESQDSSTIHHYFSLAITSGEREEITKEVDAYYAENSRKIRFNNDGRVTSYPENFLPWLEKVEAQF